MLTKIPKLSSGSLHDVAKKLLIWVEQGKNKYHTQKNFKDYNDFPERTFRYSRNFNHKLKEAFSESLLVQSKSINWNEVELKEFTKNFYTPHPNVAARSVDEVKAFWDKNNITVKGKDCPAPIFSFEETGFSEEVMKIIRKLNYTEPTPIQSQGWPIALSGLNMVGVARTGSGKTLGFILPGMIHIQNQPKLSNKDGPIALVVSPTRELAKQTEMVAAHFAYKMNIRMCCVYGGSSKLLQMQKLRRGVELCIATPGRLLDLLNSEMTNLQRCTYLVLDEADQMFDMGFEPQIRAILQQIRPDRQVLMWSATWPKEIKAITKEHIKDHIHLTVGSLDLAANPNIHQKIHVCDEGEKKQLLKDILLDIVPKPDKKILIFGATKSKVDLINFWLQDNGFQSDSIHSGKNQFQRDAILKNFRIGRKTILVATDVAARGLDVKDIKAVINYDCPSTAEGYIHRIGRTARHNSEGVSHTFITRSNVSVVRSLINVLKNADQDVPSELEMLVHRF